MLGYVLLVIGFSVGCFWMFVCESNRPFIKELKERGLTKKQRNKELVKHAKNYWPLGAIGLGWLILTVSALCGDRVCTALSLAATAVAIFVIGYRFYGEEEKVAESTAYKFLLASLGLGLGSVVGVFCFKGLFAYVLGIAWAIIIPVAAHFIWKRSINDLEDDEEDAPAPRVVAQPPQTVAQPPRASVQPPRTYYRPPNTTGQPVSRRSGSFTRTNNVVDRDLNDHIVECLSKTKEGRQILAEVLKSQT